MESRKRHPMKFGLIACCLLFLFISGDFVKASNLEQVSSPGVPTTQTVEYKISIDRTPGCHRYRPQVAFNHRHNEYLVVWHNTCDLGFRNVYARRLDINGKPIGEPFFVSDLLNMDQAHPNVTYNGEDDVYMVVWMVDVSGNNSSYVIVGSTIPWNATHHGTSFSISIGTTSYTYWKS